MKIIFMINQLLFVKIILVQICLRKLWQLVWKRSSWQSHIYWDAFCMFWLYKTATIKITASKSLIYRITPPQLSSITAMVSTCTNYLHILGFLPSVLYVYTWQAYMYVAAQKHCTCQDYSIPCVLIGLDCIYCPLY